ncbi:MAG TPA: potassium-transporting ATPase subunit KdpC [Polyangia bacterium]|jgi:K+-transporting ATPase ATPase C chain|nr:potassium-transporting ATPase subunit KdpC [Polyangia bacterium]
MRSEAITAIRVTVVTLILTGIVYPFAMTGLAQVLFHNQANGSLVRDEKGAVVGSELIGQAFANAAYVQGRPSAAGNNGYDATSSSGSNFGPTSKKLRDRVTTDVERLHKENPNAPLPVPTDLVTTSASGLDPDLSPQAALWQVPRIARARQISADRVESVIERAIQARDLGLFGEPRVNVLAANLALDQQFGKPVSAPAPASAAK